MSATQHPTPAPDTVQRLRSALLLLLAWAEAAEDPETTLDPERDQKRRRLAIAQARAVLAHVDPHAAGIRPAVTPDPIRAALVDALKVAADALDDLTASLPDSSGIADPALATVRAALAQAEEA